MKRWQEGDYLFDGFAHRGYVESVDGWRNALPDPNDYQCVRHAESVGDLFDDLCAARKRIWELEREMAQWKPIVDAACGFSVGKDGKP